MVVGENSVESGFITNGKKSFLGQKGRSNNTMLVGKGALRLCRRLYTGHQATGGGGVKQGGSADGHTYEDEVTRIFEVKRDPNLR